MKIESYKIVLFFFLLTISSCKKENTVEEEFETQQKTLFSLMPSDTTGIDFINVVKNEKNFNIFKYRNFYNGGGVAIGDINNDGLLDI